MKSFYDVLGLSGVASAHGDADIRAAYRRALLLHHPDKANALASNRADGRATYSIDEIAHAQRVLLDPTLRLHHDRELMLQARKKLVAGAGAHTGLETVDLDDLDPVQDTHGAEGDAWSKSCRCGRAYSITEAMLEQEADKGELYISCQGCSLWLKVLFQAAHDT